MRCKDFFTQRLRDIPLEGFKTLNLSEYYSSVSNFKGSEAKKFSEVSYVDRLEFAEQRNSGIARSISSQIIMSSGFSY